MTAYRIVAQHLRDSKTLTRRRYIVLQTQLLQLGLDNV
jgi:hypothetical protein